MEWRSVLCIANKKEGYTIYSVSLGFGIVVVRNVPANICSHCEHYDFVK